jgi:peptidyl-prolyl cis-trans isomerase D
MMRALRRSTKTIMIIVAVAFVIGFIFLQLGVNLGGGGGGRQQITTLGSVNGVEITPAMYQDVRNQLITQARQSSGTVSDEDYMRIEEQVWDELVYRILLEQEIKNLGIRVSDDEILEAMKSQPPDFLRTNEAFLTEGQFDQTKYLQALYSPQNAGFARELENWYRSVLPVQKLQEYLLSSIHISETQLREEYRARNEKVKVEYILLKAPEELEGEKGQVSEDEVRAYYDENIDSFRTNKRAILEYVEFPIAPDREDTLEAMKVIDEARTLLAEGRPFEEVASTISQDPGSAPKGGDLGWVPKGKMVKPVDDAAFSMEGGALSEPVMSQFGIHILKLEEKRTTPERGEERKLRHILVKLEPSYASINAISDKAQEARDRLAQTDNFAAVADSLGLEVKTANPVEKGQYVQEIGETSYPLTFAFSHSAGDVSDPVRIGERYLILRVREILPEGTKPLDTVKSEIEEKILAKRRMEEARQLAERASERLQTAGDLATVARELGVEYKESGEITRRTPVPDVGRYTRFTGVAFGLDTGETSGPIETPNGYAILKVLEKTEADSEGFTAGKESLRREVETYQRNTLMSRWYEAIREQAEIVDNRDVYLRQS